jgi:hypothetical protein
VGKKQQRRLDLPKARARCRYPLDFGQRPSVDAITGLTANIPTRIASSGQQQIDSRTILTRWGRGLHKYGVMLYMASGTGLPIRYMAPSRRRGTPVVSYLKSQAT